MESRRERLRKAAGRRRVKEISPGPEVPPSLPAGKSDRKFFSIAAGALLLALVAFVCGVQMGKSLGDLSRADDDKALIHDRKGEAPPFRLMDKGKEIPSAREAKDQPSEGKGSPQETIPPRPSPKGVLDKPAGPSKPSIGAPGDEAKPAPSKTRYTLQVGAYNNAQEAQELVQQLKKKGYDAYIAPGTGAAKGMLHRVRIGQFQTLQEARQFALAFEKKENLKPIISNVPTP
ncbi:MAG: SPOR domain-containing protein [Syntrophaceae bacterium]|nr:SPOR domain-containing protein [Syntrophaceae bacterium]